MPYYDFVWTLESIQHVADNGITVDDFERVVRLAARERGSRSSGHQTATGRADDGRRILCIYEKIDALHVLPVTAFYLERQE